MNFRMLRKDLRRKKSINLILLVFIFLSTMFIAGSLNNFAVIMNGVENFMKQAGVKDFLIVTMGESPGELSENDRAIEEFLENQEQVKDFTVDDSLFLSKNQVKRKDGKKTSMDSTGILNSFPMKQQKFFDKGNQEIASVERGAIYLSQRMAKDNKLETGDAVVICSENGYEKEFQVAGELKDAFLGSDMMGTQRCIINEEDFTEMMEQSSLPYGRMYSISCKDSKAFQAEYNNQDFHEMFGADRDLVKTTYVMELVIAAVILAVSLCLIIIAVIMLRFTIVFTVNEDYKEIGIMKAIGMPDASIRRLYMIKYFVLATVGAICGFAASIPFSRALLLQVTEKIVIEGGSSGIILQLLASICIVGLIVLFGYRSTGKIRKFSPMDAIRSGNNGERFQKKTIFQLKNARVKTTTFLAYNDVLSELKKYLVLLFTSIIGVWLVVMPINTINTLNSDGLTAWFALTDCDFYLTNEEHVIELMAEGTKEAWYEYLKETGERLEEAGIPVEKICTEVFFKLRVRKGEKSYKSFTIQGLGTETKDYFYDMGEPPIYENEVAITHVVSEKIDAKLGDTIFITSGNEEKPYVVTAVYQSMNNMGEGVRFTESADLDYREVSGGFGAQVALAREQDREKLSDTMERAEELFPESKVQTPGEFVNHMIGDIAGRLGPLKILTLAVVLAINVLVVVLMQKMFLIRERGEIGMLKSIGFSNRSLIGWQAKRVMLVLFFGIVIGTLTGAPFSQITSGQVFQMMGASKIEFVINPLEIYVVYPAALFVVTTLACIIAMRRVKRVSVQEMNHME